MYANDIYSLGLVFLFLQIPDLKGFKRIQIKRELNRFSLQGKKQDICLNRIDGESLEVSLDKVVFGDLIQRMITYEEKDRILIGDLAQVIQDRVFQSIFQRSSSESLRSWLNEIQNKNVDQTNRIQINFRENIMNINLQNEQIDLSGDIRIFDPLQNKVLEEQQCSVRIYSLQNSSYKKQYSEFRKNFFNYLY